MPGPSDGLAVPSAEEDIDRQLPAGDEIFLDHLAHFVRDAETASRAFARCGFAPTPVSIQVSPNPDGGVSPTGTGNVTAMFARGYVEVLFKTSDTALSREFDAAMAHHAGDEDCGEELCADYPESEPQRPVARSDRDQRVTNAQPRERVDDRRRDVDEQKEESEERDVAVQRL